MYQVVSLITLVYILSGTSKRNEEGKMCNNGKYCPHKKEVI